MRVCQYAGLARTVGRSGLGVAAAHQRQMYAALGAEVTSRPVGADLVHLNSVFPDAVALAAAARLLRVPVIMHAHSTEQDFRDSFRGSNLLAPLFRWWLRLAYSLGDLVLTPTPYSRRLVESLGVRAPVRDISNGVDTSFFAPDAAAGRRFRDRYALRAEDRVVISVGHMFRRKGLLDVVDVARLLPDVRFFWFGHTDRRVRTADVTAAIDTAPPNLTFAGYADSAHLRDAYCGADAFCFLSHEETEGIVVLEALACGTRTVVRDIGVYHGWLDDPPAADLVPDGPGFAERVAAVLAGPMVPELDKNGLRVARARSIGSVARQLWEILHETGMRPAARGSE